MKKLSLLIIVFCWLGLSAGEIVVESADISFKKMPDGSYMPKIDGFRTDSAGEKEMLPFKRIMMNAPVTGVELIDKTELSAPGRFSKGVDPVIIAPFGTGSVVKPLSPFFIPAAGDFYTQIYTGEKRGVPVYQIDVYPLVPLGNGKYMHIKKMKLKFASAAAKLQTIAGSVLRKKMIVVTTNAIVSNSKKLTAYINAKKALGFDIVSVTEDQYGASGVKGLEKMKAIRAYLKQVYTNYDYLLLIGDPIPETGDVPMLRAWPNYDESEYRDTPTDYIYADLSGDWNKDGNQYWGQYNSDNVTGGVDFNAELITGRISVYNNNYTNLDKILQKTIDYMNADSAGKIYRKKVLMPGAILYFENQGGDTSIIYNDGAFAIDYLKENLFAQANPKGSQFKTFTLYEQSGLSAHSPGQSNMPLTKENLVNEWKKGYGVVFWLAHGLETEAARLIWKADANSNGYMDLTWEEVDQPTMISSSDASSLSDSTPSFVFSGSCLNGTVDVTDNLGYSMLLNGAVGVVASSQTSIGASYENYSPDNMIDAFAFGVHFVTGIVDGKAPAPVMFAKKAEINGEIYGSWEWAVKMELNYLGDPSLDLSGEVPCGGDSECDDGLYCNGIERCDKGFCVAGAAVDCGKNDTVCAKGYCDETANACAVKNEADGTGCDGDTNMCEIKFCKSGSCIAQLTDCTKYDSGCSAGKCIPQTGACENDVFPDKTACDDKNLCTAGDSCSGGVCDGTAVKCTPSTVCVKSKCDTKTGNCSETIDKTANGKECALEGGVSGICADGVCAEGPGQDSDAVSDIAAVTDNAAEVDGQQSDGGILTPDADTAKKKISSGWGCSIVF